MKRIAILDLGTNTFHLLIAEIENSDSFKVIYKEKIPVKIGKGGINEQRISPDAFQRALDAIHAFTGIIHSLHVNKTIASATSAIRNATNGPELLKKIKQQTGVIIRTISGSEEAELIYNGVRAAMKIGEKPVLIMDIGGGSVEFIIANEDEIYWKRSFEIGAQRLLDKFHKKDPISPEEQEELFSFLKEELKALIIQLHKYDPGMLIGSSGTFDTLSDIYCEMSGIEKDGEKTEIPFDINAFDSIYQDIISKNKLQRLAIPGMMQMRVDMIVVAVSLIKFILNSHNFEAIRVSTYALKEGMLYKLIHEHGRKTF
ncbi:MAG: Ppx/GppA phosphatase family protein [Candidatus Cyclobacteriaceae bacterium M2_1C_046]